MEAITLEQAKSMTALTVEVYEFGFPKVWYVDINEQEISENGASYPTRTFLLKD